jgi:hypothetical protein
MASYDFSDAIGLALSKEGIDAKIFAQDAETGTNASLVAEKALKLFRIDKVDAVFTLAENNSIIEELEKLASLLKKPVYIVSLGARLGYSPTPSGFLHFIELDAWRSAWAAGHEMAKQYQSITHLVALYEAGYQFAYAFSKGVLAVPQRVSPAIFVLKRPKEQADIAEMFKVVEQGTPQAFYLSMSFKESASVLKAYGQSQWANTPLYLGPFALNEHVDAAALENIPNLYEISTIGESGAQTLEGIDVNLFSTLGFEAGSFFAKRLKQDLPSDIVVSSPRGEIMLPKNEVRVFAKQFLYKITVENGAIKKELVKTIDALPSLAQLFEGEKEVTFSQWTNPYLFA